MSPKTFVEPRGLLLEFQLSADEMKKLRTQWRLKAFFN